MVWMYHSFSVHQLMGILGAVDVSIWGARYHNAVSILEKDFVWTCVPFFWGAY